MNYTWLGGYGRDGAVTVSPPGADDAWTEGPNYDLIYGSVYCENVIAACRAKRLGFAHVLNMADNLDVIYQPAVEVIYKKVDAKEGGLQPILGALLAEAVAWLQHVNVPPNKVLINCRAGIKGAGSASIAFIYATQMTWSYNQARQFVSSKRFVCPHKDLQQTLQDLFLRVQF